MQNVPTKSSQKASLEAVNVLEYALMKEVGNKEESKLVFPPIISIPSEHKQKPGVKNWVIPPPTIYNMSGSASKKDHPIPPDSPFDQERALLEASTDTSETAFISYMDFFLGTHKDFPKEEWNDLEDKRVSINDSNIKLTQNMKRSNSEALSEMKIAMTTLLRMAENLLKINIMEEQSRLANEHGINKQYQPLAQAIKLEVCSETIVRIAGLPIIDFIKTDNFTPSQYLESTVEATIAGGESYENILLENKDNLILKPYPNIVNVAAYDACKQLSIFSIISPEIFKIIKTPCYSEIEQEIISKAREITEHASMMRNGLLKTIFSPDSSDFEPLSKKLMKYLDKEDIYITTHALMKFGLGEPINAILAYRTAESLRDNNEHPDFYAKFANSIKIFIKEFFQNTQAFNPLIAEDKIKFLPDTELEEEKLPTFEDLNRIGSRILEISSGFRFEISPNLVEFQGTEILKNIELKFASRIDPTKIEVCLFGEKTNFVITINTKKKSINWNLLDDPQKPEMRKTRNGAMILVKSILHAAQKQAEAEYQKRQEMSKVSITATINIPVKHEKKEWIPREKIKKPKPTKIQTPIEKTLLEEKNGAENKIKKHINFSKKTRNSKIIRRFSPENQKEIEKAIKEFNEDGVGIFKPLTNNIKHGDKPVFELKARKYRILTTMADLQNKEGTLYYKLYKIVQSERVSGKNSKNYL